jgi:hypothetical protein
MSKLIPSTVADVQQAILDDIETMCRVHKHPLPPAKSFSAAAAPVGAPDPRLEHARVGSWFLGPRGENMGLLKDFFGHALEEQRAARRDVYKDDPDFITADMTQTEGFKQSIEKLRGDLKELSQGLATHTIPFWSPRYNAHMNMDTAMSSIIGCEYCLLLTLCFPLISG